MAELAAGLVRPLLSHEVNRRVPADRRATVLLLEAVLFTAWLVVLEPGVFALAGRFGMGASVAAIAGAYMLVAGSAWLDGNGSCATPGHVTHKPEGELDTGRGSTFFPALKGGDSFCVKTVRTVAAIIDGAFLGTWARMLLIKWTRQRCQATP